MMCDEPLRGASMSARLLDDDEIEAMVAKRKKVKDKKAKDKKDETEDDDEEESET